MYNIFCAIIPTRQRDCRKHINCDTIGILHKRRLFRGVEREETQCADQQVLKNTDFLPIITFVNIFLKNKINTKFVFNTAADIIYYVLYNQADGFLLKYIIPKARQNIVIFEGLLTIRLPWNECE